MSMSTRDDETGLEWAGALGVAGLFPTVPQPGPAGVPADAHRDPALPPRGPRGCWRRRRTTRPCASFLDDRGFSAVLRPALHGARRRRGLVVRPGRRAGLPGALPVRLPRPPRHARRLRVTRRGGPWSAARGSTSSGSAPGSPRAARYGSAPRSPPSSRPPTASRSSTATARCTTYDAVVIATHPDQALAMLAEPTPAQRDVLSALPYSANPALLHTDASVLPRSRRARASWNFRRVADDRGQVTVTYDLTRLMRLPTETHYLVTLGGEDLVDPADRDRAPRVRPPALHPRVRRRPGPAARVRHRPGRVRRRLPRLGLPRGRRAFGAGGGRAAGVSLVGTDEVVDSDSAWSRRSPGRASDGLDHRDQLPRDLPDHDHPHPPQAVASGPSPTARTPGWSTSTTCPDHGRLAGCSAGSRRATTSGGRTRRCAAT